MSKGIRSKRYKESVNFEIKFYEGVLRNAPNFVEALALLGDLYTKTGRYKEGLYIDLRLAVLRPQEPIVLYNLACSYSLLNRIDYAFKTIKQAVKCGYDDFDYMQRDKDLTNLRQDRRFQKYLFRIKKKLSASDRVDTD